MYTSDPSLTLEGRRGERGREGGRIGDIKGNNSTLVEIHAHVQYISTKGVVEISRA